MIINILGTEYEVIKQTEGENKKLKDASGLCEIYSKRIILNEIKVDDQTYENLQAYKDRTFRHEIVHAFFAESGLRGSSDYAENEELVDWIAIQLPKIAKLCMELNIL